MAAKYQIQIGLECAINDKDQPITLDLSAKSVDAVLTQITNQKKDYTWSFADNVYDVFPKSNPDSILDVKIHEFTVTGLSSKKAADLVGQIPEISKWLITHSVSRREFQIGPSAPSSEELVTLSLNNASFRTLLNTLIRQFGIVDWVAVRYGDNQQYIGIYF